MAKKVRIDLSFEHEELQWVARIDGVKYGAHRWENRAEVGARSRYLEMHDRLDPEEIEFESYFDWPEPMIEGKQYLNKQIKEVERLNAKLEEAKTELDKVRGQYLSAWKACGMSNKGAAEMLEVTVVTANKWIEQAGGDEEASRMLFKKLGFKNIENVIGRKSERTNAPSRNISKEPSG